jgi:hypothetical protein
MEVRMGGKKLRLASGLALVVGVAAIAASPAAAKGGSHGHKNKSATPVVKVLATGLHNPRHVSIGSSHEILVAEAGQGGGLDCTTKVFTGPEGGPNCIGLTGSIARIGKHGKVTRIVTGLPSMGDAQTTLDDDNDPATPDIIVPGGGRSLGPSSVLRVGGHKIVATIGGPGPSGAGAIAAGNDITGLGTLMQFDTKKSRKHGSKGKKVKAKLLADLYAFETANDPDGAISGGTPGPDSDPTDVTKFDGGYAVADAGGNSVVTVKRKSVAALSVFAGVSVSPPAFLGLPDPFVAQSVPTAVIKYKDDAEGDDTVLVTELTGFPFIPGAARIHRVDEHGNQTVFAGGFTNIMDIVRGKHGDLWVLSIDDDSLFPPIGPSTDGAVYRLAKNGTSTKLALPAGTLTEPGGIEFDKRSNSLLITNKGTHAVDGELLQIKLPKGK